jgi:hypothetical protein
MKSYVIINIINKVFLDTNPLFTCNKDMIEQKLLSSMS